MRRGPAGTKAAALLVAAALITVACSSTPLLDDVATPTTDPGPQPSEPDDGASDDGGSGDGPTDGDPVDDGTAEPPPPAPDGPGVVGADGLGDDYLPRLGNGGYDVARYDLQIRHDPADGDLSATATIEATATDRLDTFNLDFIGYDITDLTVDGAPTEFERNGSELTIDPTDPLPAGEEFVVVVDYNGEPTQVEDPTAPIIIGWLLLGSGSFVLSEPSGSQGWFPANDHPSDKALFRFEITAPDDLVVVANGLLQSRVTDDGWTTWVYEPEDPMATYLSTVAIGDYVLTEEEGPDGIVIRNAFHESLADAAEFDFGRTDEMLELFIELFGPYPFEAYGVIAVDVPFGAALETQTISVFSADIVTGSRFFEDIVAHELAHQWFGDHVALEQWRDNWLKEGFATYSEFLWRDHIDDSYDIDAEAEAIRARNLSPPGDPGLRNLYGSGVYLRGGLTLHALRRTVGDDTFFDILRTFVTRFGGGNASAEEFIALAGEVSGTDLDDFFDAWLYDVDTPELP